MKQRRWFRRALRLGLCGLLALLLGALAATWWGHRHLTRLVVDAFNRSYPDLQLSAKTVAISSSGELDLRAVQLRIRREGADAIVIPSAQVRFSWRDLQRQSIREIVIDEPRVHVSDALLAAFGGGSSGSSSGAAWQIGKISINRGTASVEVSGLPTARFGFGLQFATSEPAQNQLTITNLHLRAPGSVDDEVIVPSLRMKASPEELRVGKIREIALDAPQLRLTDALRAALPKSSDDSATPSWSVDRLSVREGQVRVDLAAWPQAAFRLSAQAQDLAQNGAAELVVTELSVRPREQEENALFISSLRVALAAAGLRNQTIQEIEIDDPQVNVTDPLLAWRPPPSTPSTAAPEKPAWKIQRLAVKRGRARVDVAGAPLAEFGFGLRLQNASLSNEPSDELQSLEVLDLAVRARQQGVEPFLCVPAIRAEFRLPELLHQRRIARVRVEHLDFRYNAAFRAMIATGARPATPAAPAPSAEVAPTPVIGELRLSDGRMHLDDLGIGIPGIECRIETSFSELALAAGAGAGGNELQKIELSQLTLRSPLDPFVTVLDLDTVFIRFTLEALWRREIAEIEIIRPTLAIGPDLFWYVDRVQQNQDAPPADAPVPDDGPAWSIRRFSATSGKLILALEGQAKLPLPMPFESHAENLNFSRLSELRLKLQIEMPEQNYDYPGYDLALLGVSGRIEFSLPPAQGSNNVVNTLRLRDVRWKNFRGKDVFLDVTYDERGIYGNLTGKGYTGILRGQFNFMLEPHSPWNGWVAGTHIDLGPITHVLAPEKFSLTGPADFRLTVAARATEILNVNGDYKSRAKGQMRIGKLDEYIEGLPGDWSSMKKALSRISLETLRDFTYDTAHGAFQFTGLTGAVHLDLRGPQGSRKIDMKFHELANPARVATRRP